MFQQWILNWYPAEPCYQWHKKLYPWRACANLHLHWACWWPRKINGIKHASFHQPVFANHIWNARLDIKLIHKGSSFSLNHWNRVSLLLRLIHKLPWWSRQHVSMVVLNQNFLWIVNEIKLRYFHPMPQAYGLVAGHVKYQTHWHLQSCYIYDIWIFI